MFMRSMAVAVMLGVTTPLGTAAAQSSSGLHFLFGAGATLPTGPFADRNDVGYNGVAGIAMTQPGSPLGFRVEGIYNEFNSKAFDGKAHAGGVTANATFDLMPGQRASGTLYGLAGAGYYSTREPFLFSTAQTNFGWNLGGGFRFPLSGFAVYLEARYHHISNVELSMLPITFGVVF